MIGARPQFYRHVCGFTIFPIFCNEVFTPLHQGYPSPLIPAELNLEPGIVGVWGWNCHRRGTKTERIKEKNGTNIQTSIRY